MAVWNLLPQIPSVITAEQLTSLGFVNVPAGYWQLKSTLFGDSQPDTDHSTIIPLVGKGYRNSTQGNDSGNMTVYCNFSINGKSAMSGTGRKYGTGYGNIFADLQSNCLFYPYFYDYDLTATMAGVNKEGDRSVNLENVTRTCVAIYLWLEQATSTNLTNSRGMNFPAGNWHMVTSSTSADDIPVIVAYSGSGRNPDGNVNSQGIIGYWCYKTNGTGTGLTYGMYDPAGYGLFLPAVYNYDMIAVQNARSAIVADSRLSVTAWLTKGE